MCMQLLTREQLILFNNHAYYFESKFSLSLRYQVFLNVKRNLIVKQELCLLLDGFYLTRSLTALPDFNT